MKKIAHPILLFILLIFINGCAGYEPIFSSKNLQFKIVDFSIEDNKTLGNKIYSKLYNLSKSTKDDQNVRDIDLLIKVSKEKIATTKDSAGKILEYKITLNTKINIKDFVTDKNILDQNFLYSMSFNVQEQHSETIKLEERSIDIMIENTYQDLLVKLSQYISAE